MGSQWHNGFMFGGGLMWIFWILLIVLAVILTVALAQRRTGTGSGARERTALDILKERYARGEIDRDEFEQIRRDLGT